MFTKLFASSFLGLGLLFAGISAGDQKAQDCCTANLACCKANMACCAIPTWDYTGTPL